jgi:serine acetyltransferase
MSSLGSLIATVKADHAGMREIREKYPTEGSSMQTRGLIGDAVQKIGFQMLIAVRVMRFAKQARIPFGPQLVSRLIRHLYGAEIHWDAQIAEGVCFIHGTGLVISHAATIGPRCILFQNVTLGESIDPVTREVGGPTLEADVHVGPGAVLIGPIVIGAGSKIMANAVIDRSIPPRSIVRSPAVEVVERNNPTTTSVHQPAAAQQEVTHQPEVTNQQEVTHLPEVSHQPEVTNQGGQS